MQPGRAPGDSGARTRTSRAEIAIWDASAETRCLVLPSRPAGAGHLGEPELAGLVTRNR